MRRWIIHGLAFRFAEEGRSFGGRYNEVGLDVRVDGIKPHKDLEGWERVNTDLVLSKELAKGFVGLPNDANPHTISGSDETYGDIVFDIREDPSELIIEMINYADRGGQQVNVFFIGKYRSGEILRLMSLAMTREQFNAWIKRGNEIKNGFRPNRISN